MAPKIIHHGHHGAHHRGPDVVVYRQAQEDVVLVTPEDEAKATLYQLIRTARQTILGRVNQLPGSMASTELWVRYRHMEDRALTLGGQGLWTQALAQFRQEYTQLLSAAPTGDAEPIGKGVGDADGMSGAGRRARRAFLDFLRQAFDALQSGDQKTAWDKLDRAKREYHSLEPSDLAAAQEELRTATAKIDYATGGIPRESTRVLRRGQADVLAFRSSETPIRGGRVLVRSQGVADVSSTAGIEIQGRQDSVINSGNQLKTDAVSPSRTAALAAASPVGLLGSILSGGNSVSDPFGEAYQNALTPLFDQLSFINRLLQQSLDRGQVVQDEYDQLRLRSQAIQNWLSQKSKDGWDEGAFARTVATKLGGVTSKLGITTPQSGQDYRSQQDVQSWWDGVKKSVGDTLACIKAAGTGDVAGVWRCLPTVGKVAVVGAAALGAVKTYHWVKH